MAFVFSKSRSKRINLLAIMVISASAIPALAETREPVAIVEDASANAPVAVFDYLHGGEWIELSGGAQVVIGYFASCRLESIVGGRVIIGQSRSEVLGGKIDVSQVDCDAGQIDITPDAAAASGVAVFRARPGELPKVFSATPVILLDDAIPDAPLSILRRDRPEPARILAVRGGRVDLSESGTVLTPGGDYEIRHGQRSAVFRVVVYARPDGQLITRLVRF